jgi:putative transcriptional regulator
MRNMIKVFRAMNDLTQDELAEQLGVSRQTIINIEKGNTEPSIKIVLQMARVFNCKVEELFME